MKVPRGWVPQKNIRDHIYEVSWGLMGPKGASRGKVGSQFCEDMTISEEIWHNLSTPVGLQNAPQGGLYALHGKEQ